MNSISTVIDYDKLCNDYKTGLVETLRNFDVKSSYIELWVPDENLHKSLLNLFVAARTANQNRLSVALGPKTALGLDRAQLTEALRQLKATIQFLKEDDRLVLDVSSLTEAEQQEPGVLKNYSGERETKRRTDMAAHAMRYAITGDEDLEPEDIVPAYRDAVMQSAARPDFNGKPAAKDGSLVAEGRRGSARLFVAADQTTLIITNVGYAGVTGSIGRGLLEHFAALCVGLTVQEAADHGVLRLEHELRSDKTARPLAGIAHPRAIDPAFRWVEHLIRAALADWRQRTGYDGIVNEFDSGPGTQWRDMSEGERKEWLMTVIGDLTAEKKLDLTGVSVVNIEHDVRVVVSLPREWTSGTKARTVFSLEREIKTRIDRRLEIHSQELKDRNAIRRLK